MTNNLIEALKDRLRFLRVDVDALMAAYKKLVPFDWVITTVEAVTMAKRYESYNKWNEAKMYWELAGRNEEIPAIELIQLSGMLGDVYSMKSTVRHINKYLGGKAMTNVTDDDLKTVGLGKFLKTLVVDRTVAEVPAYSPMTEKLIAAYELIHSIFTDLPNIVTFSPKEPFVYDNGRSENYFVVFNQKKYIGYFENVGGVKRWWLTQDISNVLEVPERMFHKIQVVL